MSDVPVLALEAVGKSFALGFIPRRRTVISDLSFTVQAGEVFGFLGQNGAGKTTTIKLLVGLLFPDRGTIRIRGIDAGEPRARRALGFLPENPYFEDDLTGPELLDYYGRLLGLPPGVRKTRAGDLIERLSLGRAASAALPLRRYSKGMLQRLGLAQALLGKPDLLVLDEPMSGLDPVGRRDFRDLFLAARAAGTTIFFSSHILQDAEMICDRVAILADGRLRSVGLLRDLLEAGGGGYEVTFDGPALAAEPGRPEVKLVGGVGGASVVRVADLAEAERLVDRVRGAGGRVRQMVPLRATLEDLFLAEVGRGSGGDVEASAARPS